jgi:TonB family protein
MIENARQWEGQVVDGRFPLSQYLGGGDHSAVFATASDDLAIGTAVLKLIETDPADAEIQLARWKSAAAVSHSHLVRLFRTGRAQLDGKDLIYLVMERADEDLSQVLPQRPLSADETLEALDPALDALAYVHSRGLVHGRLRPANLLAVGGRLKLSSDRLRPAGEARSASEEPGPYDAPETAHAGIAPAADVWSLGVTLVEALTQHAQPERELPPGLPAPLLDIVRHCLERAPERRWTVAQIQARLRPPAPAVRTAPPAKPRRKSSAPRYAGLAVAFALVLAAIVASPRLFNRRQEPEKPPATPAPVERASPAPQETPAPAAAPGGVLERVLPDVLASARNSIRGKVRVSVQVRVDPSGAVTSAELAAPASSQYFSRKALEAARQWRFSPPQAGGQAVASGWLLRFEFERSGANVTAQRTPEP